MAALLHLGTPVERMLVSAVLAPTITLMAYGAIVSFRTEATDAVIRQADAQRDYILTYADGQKAIFRTAGGQSVLMVGSPLEGAGRIASIARADGRWTVTTTRGVVFSTD